MCESCMFSYYQLIKYLILEAYKEIVNLKFYLRDIRKGENKLTRLN